MYPKHVLVAFGGVLGSANDPAEIWSCSLRVRTHIEGQPDRDATVEECEGYLEDTVRPALQTFLSSGSGATGGYAKTTWVKVNAINADGKYVHDETVEYRYPTPLINGGSDRTTPMFPLQASLVVTLETGKNSRFAKKGRFYLPAPQVTLDGKGLIPSASVTGMTNAAAAFINSLEDLQAVGGGIEWTPAVVSPQSTTGAEGTWNAVTAVSIDTRLDIQRSRASNQKPSRIRVATTVDPDPVSAV